MDDICSIREYWIFTVEKGDTSWPVIIINVVIDIVINESLLTLLF